MRGFLSMTCPRAHLVDAENGGLYHCLSRCVRRAWLCGEDAASGRSFEHRKEWVEHCLLNLASIFTVNLFGYAVLSNHYHLIIETLPHEARQLTDVEVAQRWLRLSPSLSEKTAQKRLAALLDNPTRLAELRLRLGSLSWFMRYINEPIARRANKEDGCKGRFWEGRFQSFALLDEPAAVCGLTYVDLNPIRAAITTSVQHSPHTSIKRRIALQHTDCAPLADLSRLGLTLSSYRQLLEWTVALERGAPLEPSDSTRHLFKRFGHQPADWHSRVMAIRRHYRAYGSADNLKRYADKIGQRWIKGTRTPRSNSR